MLLSKTPPVDVKSDVLPMIYRALESETTQKRHEDDAKATQRRRHQSSASQNCTRSDGHSNTNVPLEEFSRKKGNLVFFIFLFFRCFCFCRSKWHVHASPASSYNFSVGRSGAATVGRTTIHRPTVRLRIIDLITNLTICQSGASTIHQIRTILRQFSYEQNLFINNSLA